MKHGTKHKRKSRLSGVSSSGSSRALLVVSFLATLLSSPRLGESWSPPKKQPFCNEKLKQWKNGVSSTAIAGSILAASLLTFPLSADADSNIAYGKRYWSIMETSPPLERVAANEALLDYAVGTINTQYYDNTGGARFNTKEFYQHWRTMKQVANHEVPVSNSHHAHNSLNIPTDVSLESRDGAVHGLKWLVNSLEDPFSKYLTREELKKELQGDSYGFLGTGAVVEPPNMVASNKYGPLGGSSILMDPPLSSSNNNQGRLSDSKPTTTIAKSTTSQQQQQQQQHAKKKFLTVTRVANLPVITAVAPDSPAERAGLVVGDRIVAVGDVEFLGWNRPQVAKTLQTTFHAESYLGHAQLTVAKPVYYIGEPQLQQADETTTTTSYQPQAPPKEFVIGYRQARVLVPSKASEARPFLPSSLSPDSLRGGDNIVHYELLTSSSGNSIFDHLHSDGAPQDDYKVGYIRMTRFSKKSTEGYLKAIQDLEAAGAQSFILDLRNNYGGIIQEAMLTASTLLRDPHAILCYTMNARGGFTPHDVEEYVADARYPGYLLSKESTRATLEQVRRETPGMFADSGVDWDPPSSFASLHEQITKRGIHRVSYSRMGDDPLFKRQVAAQKKIVILVNEGTASSAEVFTAALHDNARTVALVGTRTYGKGLIQHTFPMPDGGGLRITVAEYLTPALKHVTHVGGARFDPQTGSFVGGGIAPDIHCESKGIPGNIRADLCVGVALDALEEASESSDDSGVPMGPFAWGFPSSILGKNR